MRLGRPPRIRIFRTSRPISRSPSPGPFFRVNHPFIVYRILGNLCLLSLLCTPYYRHPNRSVNSSRLTY
jgi:hypothetical protein